MKVYKPDPRQNSSIFEDPEFLSGSNLEITDNPEEADIITSRRLHLITHDLLKLDRLNILWTHEPTFDNSASFIRTPFDKHNVYVFNVYNGNIYTDNYYYGPRPGLAGLSSERFVPNVNFHNKKIVSVMTAREGDRGAVVDGVDVSLYRERQGIALDGHRRKMLDIYGRGWPEGVAIEESRRSRDRSGKKLSILSNYNFCLCSENTLWDYYITEKFWESIQGNCLPIYHRNNTIDLDVDPSLYIALDRDDDLDTVLERMSGIGEADFRARMGELRRIAARAGAGGFRERSKDRARRILWSFIKDMLGARASGQPFRRLAGDYVRTPAGERKKAGPSARTTFLANCSGDFGARLRAVLNAMCLAGRHGGAFRILWREKAADKDGRPVAGKDGTFSEAFAAAHLVGGGGAARSKGRKTAVPAKRMRSTSGPGDVKVGRKVPPRLARGIPGGAARRAFARIGFSERLETARKAADDVALPGPASALHLHAVDIVHGRIGLRGHQAGKATAYPLALGLAGKLRAEGQTVVLFGEDEALCGHVARAHGCVWAGGLAAELDFDRDQAALFEIALMSRCGQILASPGGLAKAAAQIAAVRARRPESGLRPEEIRDALLRALAGTDAAEGVSDRQRAFAFWSAAHRYGDLFSAEERDRFLEAAGACDPGNGLYRLARIGSRLELGDAAWSAAALDALVAEAARGRTDDLRAVLTTRRRKGGAAVQEIVRGFAGLAEQGHVGALLCLALASRDPAVTRASAARFLALRPDGLGAWDADVRPARAGRRPAPAAPQPRRFPFSKSTSSADARKKTSGSAVTRRT
jgi:hypothetical protein